MDCLEEILAKLETAPASRGTGCPLPLRAKDRPIFEAARRWRATHLLTGDIRDFGPFMNAADATCGVVIQTVAEFLSEIERG